MEGYLVMRSLGAVVLLLGTCAGALWFVKRFRITLPGHPLAGQGGRLALVERISIDGRHTIILVRRDDREHLIALTPEGTTIIETGIPAESRSAPAPALAPVARPVSIDMTHVMQAIRALTKRWPDLRPAATALLARIRAGLAHKTAAWTA